MVLDDFKKSDHGGPPHNRNPATPITPFLTTKLQRVAHVPLGRLMM